MRKYGMAILAALVAMGVQVSAQENPNDLKSYLPILEKYRVGSEQKWSMQEFSENGLCYLYGYNPETIGYFFEDLNKDGVQELVLGDLEHQTDSYSGFVYDVYTLENGSPKLVLSSAERDGYSLCEGQVIEEQGSGSAFESCWLYYTLSEEDTTLKLIESVRHDGYYDSENPWFHSVTSDKPVESTPEDYVSVTEGEAKQIIAKYESRKLEFTPIQSIELPTGGEWVQEEGQWKYLSDTTGDYYQDGIYEIDGKKYYFDYMGHRFSGWRTVDDQLYYFNSKGVMQTGKKKINGMSYTFREDGTLESCGKKAVVSTTLSPDKTHYIDLDGDGTEESLYYPSGMMEMSLYINDQLLFQASTGNIEMPLRLHKIGKKGIYLEYGEYVNWSYVSHCMLRYKNGEIVKMDFDVGDPKDGLKRQSEVELVDQDTLTVGTTEMFGATSWITWKQTYHVTKNAITLQGNEFPVLGAKRKWIASKGFDVYKEPGSSEAAFRVEPGDAVKIKKIYLDGNTKYGKIVKGKQKGYINLSATEMNDIYFEDVYYAS